MSKPSRDETLMGVARLWSAHSTCSRLAVGAVISRDGRSFSTGYNGAPAGMPHCVHEKWTLVEGDLFRDETPEWVREFLRVYDLVEIPWGATVYYDGKSFTTTFEASHPGPGCTTAVHAELNALMFAARYGLATEGAEIHTTYQPCLNCAMAIVNAGVQRVVFEHPYRDNGGLDLLRDAGITVQTMADMSRVAEINRRAAQKGI